MLKGAESGKYSFPITGSEFQSDNLTFTITGPQETPAKIRLDNLNLVLAEAIAIRTATFLQDGRFSLQVTVAPKGDYRVERSSDLQQWETVIDLQNVEGTVEAVDPDRNRAAQRFYRVRRVDTAGPIR